VQQRTIRHINSRNPLIENVLERSKQEVCTRSKLKVRDVMFDRAFLRVPNRELYRKRLANLL